MSIGDEGGSIVSRIDAHSIVNQPYHVGPRLHSVGVRQVERTDAVTMAALPRTRAAATRNRRLLERFNSIISNDLLEWLTSVVNKNMTENRGARGPSSVATTVEEMRAFIHILVGVINTTTTMKAYLETTDPKKRLGSFMEDDQLVWIGINRWTLLVKYLVFDDNEVTELFKRFSAGLASLVVTTSCGQTHLAADESMIPWRSKCGKVSLIVTLPRKPQSTGFRVYTLAVSGTESGQPFVLCVIPDFVNGCHLPYKVCCICLRRPS